MVEKTREIKVTNRDNSKVGYTISDLNLHRSFSAGETKTVTFGELEKLAWETGGLVLLKNYLIIEDREAAEELLDQVEPEYFYTEDTIETLLTKGTLEQLEDALDFAPKGVIDLIKQKAVDLQLNNVAMRKAIYDKTNFNVNRAIEINEESKESESDAAITSRRTSPIAASGQEKSGGRRVTPIIIKK